MILTYLIKNNTDSDFPLEPNETWKFIVNVDDEQDAYVQLEKVKLSAGMYQHTIMNVYLDGVRFDAREYWTEGANSDSFEYDDLIKVDQIWDETKPPRLPSQSVQPPIQSDHQDSVVEKEPIAPTTSTILPTQSNNKKSKKYSIWIVISVLFLVLISYYAYKQVMIDVTIEKAFLELFGNKGSNGKLKTVENEKTGLLVKLKFNYKNQEHLVFFTKTQEIDAATGVITYCHICRVKLSAVVFKKVENSWRFVSKSKYFTELGKWGDAFIYEPIQIYKDFATNSVGFFIDESDMGQGYTTEWKTIIAYSNDRWSDLGFVKTAENNEGACNESEEAKLKGEFRQCWEYQSSIKFVSNPSALFPHIIVNRSGTMLDKNYEVIKANIITYRYENDGYKSDGNEDE